MKTQNFLSMFFGTIVPITVFGSGILVYALWTTAGDLGDLLAVLFVLVLGLGLYFVLKTKVIPVGWKFFIVLLLAGLLFHQIKMNVLLRDTEDLFMAGSHNAAIIQRDQILRDHQTIRIGPGWIEKRDGQGVKYWTLGNIYIWVPGIGED